MSNPRDVPPAAQPSSSSADTWDAIRPELEKRFGGQPAQQTAVDSIAAANSAAAQVAMFGYAPSAAPKPPEEPAVPAQAVTGTWSGTSGGDSTSSSATMISIPSSPQQTPSTRSCR
ncbi:hypothetical protein GCM10023320_23900 [Pseudonocardia adelaidensis]|uniref:PPE family protein n=1 Tax=Pseudonocardia adelaidensis TaxID=648754 RepID=A0ABP9NGR3_9PSEU